MLHIDDSGRSHVVLGIMDLNIPLPEKVYLHHFTLCDPEELYIKQIYCNPLVTIDEDEILGSCVCSNCKKEMNPFYKFCPNCGAKAKERIFLEESEEPSNA